MKLKRTWPATGIWVIFLLFNILMVGSYSFFSGLFPQENRLVYSIILTVLSVLTMSVITNGLGKLCDSFDTSVYETRSFNIIYSILLFIVIAGGVIYRIEILSIAAGDITGNYSLYENAMVGVTPKHEFDLLSIVYTAILKPVLFFTGNIISVPFFFQIACFTVFIILATITVRMLLGMAAAFIFATYTSFMPVFTVAFTGLELSTDSLFIAMFGIELLIVALFLKGIAKRMYTSRYWIIWYMCVGAVIAFMTYVDAGTFILIIPFLLASLVICGTDIKSGLKRLLFIVLSGIFTFLALLSQEAGIGLLWARLQHWGEYFFKNTNTFSTFWTYTDYKILYLITVIGMSGVIVGYWKNRNIERVSPWLFSMLLVFATVPFMGPTRMNSQAVVTIYYAFILACVASLITLRADETEEEPFDEEDGNGVPEEDEDDAFEEDEDDASEEDESDTSADVYSDAAEEAKEAKEEPSERYEGDASSEDETDASKNVRDRGSEEKDDNKACDQEAVNDASEDDDVSETKLEYISEIQKVPVYSTLSDTSKEEDAAPVPEPVPVDEYVITLDERAGSARDLQEAIRQLDELAKVPEMLVRPAKAEKRFIPEGMVLPEDDVDADMTPRMRMPQLKKGVGTDGNGQKLKVTGSNTKKKRNGVDFDFPLREGDDFDI